MAQGQAASRLTTRDLTMDDLEMAFDVRSRSFGVLGPALRGWWNDLQRRSIDGHRAIGVFDGRRLLAHARVHGYQQYWGGRPMAMGGVAGVVVAPEARGRGVGSYLLTALAQRSFELGDLVSALYPATIPMYRALGWEVAGAQYRISMSAEALRNLGRGDVPLRTANSSDVEPFLAGLHERYVSQRANGPKLPTATEAGELLTDAGMMSYLTTGGHVVYEWAKEDLVVSYLAADTPEVARALWSVVGSGSSVARNVRAYVAPLDAIHLLLPEEVDHETYLKRWMLRVLDVRKAVAARGFPPGLTGSAAFALQDQLLPDNGGSWQLDVSDGRGQLAPTAALTTSLKLCANGFAALYAGTPLHVLRTAGLVSDGDPAGDMFLEAAFAGPPPYLLEYF